MRKKQTLVFAVASAVSLILSVSGFIISGGKEYVASKILMVICSCLLAVLSLLYITIFVLSSKSEPNFYLFDESKGINITIEQLNFTIVSLKTRNYIDKILGGYNELLFDRILLDDSRFGASAVLRPAITYQLLYDASDNSNGIDILMSSGEKNQKAICNCLASVGETDLVDVLKKQFAEKNASGLSRFLKGNRRYIAGRQLAYVRRNIDKFY